VTSVHRPWGGEQLSPRDLAVLQTAGALRLVTGGQLQRLFFSDPEDGSTSPRIARRTLQRLTDLRLLVRLERRLGGLRAGSSSYTYALTPAGGRAIGGAASRGRSPEPSLTFVRHTLAIAEVATILTEAKRSGLIDAVKLQTEPDCWRDLGGYERTVLKPDLFVEASVADSDHLAWVEVDLGTEHGPALVRKARIYETYFRSGREQERTGVFPRVLWLAETPTRQRAIRTALHRASGLTADLHRVGLLDDPVGWLTGRSIN
jgi:hypothetical protein